ncbi:Hep/Hag repeat protein [Ostertagia ostertagi]
MACDSIIALLRGCAEGVVAGVEKFYIVAFNDLSASTVTQKTYSADTSGTTQAIYLDAEKTFVTWGGVGDYYNNPQFGFNADGFNGYTNLYPNFLLHLYRDSPTHGAIVNQKANYIVGNGLKLDGKDIDVKVNPSETLSEFVSQNGAKIVLEWQAKDGKGSEVKPLSAGDWDKAFTEIAKNVKDTILEGHEAPPSLFNMKTAGAIGNNQEMANNYKAFKDNYIAVKRSQIESALMQAMDDLPPLPNGAGARLLNDVNAPVAKPQAAPANPATQPAPVQQAEADAEAEKKKVAKPQAAPANPATQPAPVQQAEADAEAEKKKGIRKLTAEDYEQVKHLGVTADDFDVVEEMVHNRQRFSTESDIADYIIANDIKGLTIDELVDVLKKEGGIKTDTNELRDVLQALKESGLAEVDIDRDGRIKVTPVPKADVPDTDKETAYKPIIGKALFEGLTQAVYDCSVSGVSLSEAYINLIEASKPYIIAKTVTNKGVQKLNDNSSTSLSSGDIEGVKQYYNNLISGYKSDLVQFLKDSNLIDYRNDLEITNQSTGWFFEGVTLTTQIDQAQEASIDDYVQAESTYTYQQLSELNKVLLISVNDVFANSPIEDNVDVKLLARTIQQVQQVNLKPILTEGIYNNVLFAVQALSLSGEAMSSLYSDLLSIIKPYLINKTVAEFVIPNQYKFTAKGLMKMNVNSASDLSDGDLTNVKDYYDNLSTTYKESIIAFLKKYKLTSIYSDDSITSDASGWFFEGGLTPVNSGSQGNISPLANDNYTISATLDGRIAYFNTNNALSAYTLDLSTLVITGGSVSGAYLPLSGGTLTGLVTANTVITAVTFSNNTLAVNSSDGTSKSALINNLTGLTVTGAISATTYYGNGANLTGIASGPGGNDTQVQYNNGGILTGLGASDTAAVRIQNPEAFSTLFITPSTSSLPSTTGFFAGTGNGFLIYPQAKQALRALSDRVYVFGDSDAGNFGVGLNNPLAKLHVLGNSILGGGVVLVSTVINNFTGLTVNGIISATTISASTFVGNGAGLTGVIGSNERITGGTFSNNSLTLTNTTGGTVSTTINNFTGVTVNGLLSAATITASTLSVAGNVNEAFNGNNTSANGSYAHAEGFQSNAIGDYTHAEGGATQSSGTYSHAEGVFSIASGQGSHAEGYSTTANINGAHAEGSGTTASGTMSHAEGSGTTASGQGAHAEGLGTIAAGNNQHVEGTYNNSNTTALMIIGNGTSAAARADLAIFNQNTIVFNKPVGLSVQVPLANLHITGGTTTVAPMILASGTTLLTPINGTVEYNGSNLFFTPTGATRQTVIVGQTGTTPVTTGSVNTWLAVSINGIQYKIPMYK